MQRQHEGLDLIAWENFVSQAVLQAMGSIFTNKGALGPHSFLTTAIIGVARSFWLLVSRVVGWGHPITCDDRIAERLQDPREGSHNRRGLLTFAQTPQASFGQGNASNYTSG